MMDMPMTAISGPSAWLGPDMAARMREWFVTLDTDTITELEAAAAHFLSLGRDVGEITAKNFPLPRFSAHLKGMADRLLNGCGFEVLHGWPVEQHDQLTNAAVFCGIGAHLGSARSQNAAGHVLGHVRDVGMDPDDPKARIYQTNARQSFHTDSADVVALLCLRDAKEGGESLLVSAVSVFNRMLDEAPDLAAALFAPIATDRRGEVPEGMEEWMTIPVLSWYEGRLSVFYQRQYIESAQRFDGAPKLDDRQRAALDMFDVLCDDPGMNIQMRLEPGDMQFVYNHSQLHDRTGFTDWPDPAQRRHLFRLWLSMPDDRPLPPVFSERYGSLDIGNRGGIITDQTRLHAPID
ncbi:TauD/TfdA family dioxygenase [Alisedimentitalea sp. MJ-SS2]|uniref:TauD/TfdA family dioxygenase n=1 Tax=Aliisedimentitalea sp. MJ-SS2 TaxID=3049795 RepID=UPI00290CFDC3|nr:TauD/TfdA family dioxygenase [Alisedimentitalea sp. MJ-SS2]MDU8928637.1 TauD/TfdA family dioxygenase [Alisedimentitalea sp. MJ-SS2]